MSESVSAEELVAALSSPNLYPHGPEEVTLIETHISWVFLAGERVYKVKKPVVFPFLDYGTLERRERMCHREVELNSRLAPHLYRGVVPIHRGERGISLEGDGEIVAWAVEMSRLPEGRMFHHLLERGELDTLALRRVAETLAHFHARCETGPGIDEQGAFEVVAGNIRDNFRDSEAHVGACVGRRQFDALRGWFEERLERLRPLIQARPAAGRIRAGHGDMRAEHLLLMEDGTVIAYDGIEFDDQLRCCDVASELAFLCMDMHSYGFHHFAQHLARLYAERASDPDLLTLLPLYTAYRAHVRAKVDGMRMAQLEAGPQREEARLRAAQHYHLAWVATRRRPVLILTYGLAGSGKSTLSREAARTLGLHWLRSDVVHKRLQGAQPGERLTTGFLSGAYTQEAKARTYVELLRLAEGYMERGESVVVDASFGYPYMRDPFMARIEERGWDHLMLEVAVSPEESRRRLDLRAAAGTDASDATWDIYLKQRDAFVPPVEIDRRITVDGTLPPQDQIGRVVEALLE